MVGEIFTRAPARRFACLSLRLKRGRRSIETDGIGKALGKPGIAKRDGPAFGLVAVQQRFGRLSFQDCGKLPAKIDGILDRGVVTHATGRREQMDRIAAEEHTSGTKAIGHQRTPGDPEIA